MSRKPRVAQTIIRNERGSSLITLLGFAVVVSMTYLAILSVINFQNRSAKQVEFNTAAVQIRQTMLSYLENDRSWTEIVNDTHNTSLNCVRTGISCSSVSSPNNRIRIIKDVSGTVVYDTESNSGVDGDPGFTMSGDVCNGFSNTAGVGDTSCLFKVELEWLPDCSSVAGCIGAPIEIIGRIVRRDDIEGPFNASAFDFRISR